MGLRRGIVATCLTAVSACSSFGASPTGSPAPTPEGGVEAGSALDSGLDAAVPFCDGQPGAKICDSFESGISSAWTEQVHLNALITTDSPVDAPSAPFVFAAASGPAASSSTPANGYLRELVGDNVAVHLEADVRLEKRAASASVQIGAVYADTTPRVTIALQVGGDGNLYLIPSNGDAVKGPAFPDGWRHVVLDVAQPGSSPAAVVTLDGVKGPELPSVGGLDTGPLDATIGITYATDPGWLVYVDNVVVR